MSQKPSPRAAARAKKKAEKQVHREQNVWEPVEIKLRTENQKRAWQILEDKSMSFLLGSAGSGKTFLAMAYAINEVLSRRYEKIVLTRPIVEAGEKLGFLPGTFGEKVNPYMQPLYDTMEVLLGKQSKQREIINKAVVLAPLCYLRGRTFNDSICILDEAQNASYQQLKLFLSRFGQHSKIVVTGDPEQSDLFHKDIPLMTVVDKIKDIKGVGTLRFTNQDVVRHPLVGEVLKRL
jgi:phosphate starvation-inducible PhoH-like protein